MLEDYWQQKSLVFLNRPGERRQDKIDDLVKVALNQPGVDPMEEPIIRNQITVQQDYKTLEENNPNVDFADQFEQICF